MNAKIFVLTVLLLQSVNQAYSIECYKCISGVDADCVKDPVPKKYAVECDENSIIEIPSSLTADHSIRAMTSNYASRMDLQCASIALSNGTTKSLSRGCVFIISNCKNYKKFAEIAKLTLDSCNLCEADLCNSSSALNAGFVTLMMAIFVGILSR